MGGWVDWEVGLGASAVVDVGCAEGQASRSVCSVRIMAREADAVVPWWCGLQHDALWRCTLGNVQACERVDHHTGIVEKPGITCPASY